MSPSAASALLVSPLWWYCVQIGELESPDGAEVMSRTMKEAGDMNAQPWNRRSWQRRRRRSTLVGAETTLTGVLRPLDRGSPRPPSRCSLPHSPMRSSSGPSVSGVPNRTDASLDRCCPPPLSWPDASPSSAPYNRHCMTPCEGSHARRPRHRHRRHRHRRHRHRPRASRHLRLHHRRRRARNCGPATPSQICHRPSRSPRCVLAATCQCGGAPVERATERHHSARRADASRRVECLRMLRSGGLPSHADSVGCACQNVADGIRPRVLLV